MKKLVLCLICLLLTCSSVVMAKSSKNEIITPQTQLQKRQYQTRNFSGVSKPTVMKAMLNVLQDQGFMVYNANPILGFISGSKEFSPGDKSIDMQREFGTTRTGGAVVAVVEATANVSEFGKDVRVRINFKRKLLNIYGNAQKIEEITDEAYYQNFFSSVDKAIFIKKKKI